MARVQITGRNNNTSTYVDGIQVKVDLDSLIMSKECSPEYLETNLDIGDHLLYDAILNSTCSGWLLKLDVLEGFSKYFRRKIFGQFGAFPLLIQTYFLNQVEHTFNRTLYNDYTFIVGSPNNTSMFNPMTMLGNQFGDRDLDVIHGKITLRQFLDSQIDKLLSTKDMSQVDFSYSIFLPEMLNPKFFFSLREAEQVVILSNLDKYFKFLSQFRGVGLRGSGLKMASSKQQLNIPQNLVKWILSGEPKTSRRVKMIAWNRMYAELMRISDKFLDPVAPGTKVYRFCDSDRLNSEVNKGITVLQKKMEQAGHGVNDVEKWISDADGLFESFELDCTLHGMNAVDFLPLILSFPKNWKMLDGLVKFQDEDEQLKVLKRISDCMVSFK